MTKKEYIAPQSEIIVCEMTPIMDKGSYTITEGGDTDQNPIVEGDPDIVFSKGNDGLDDSWDMWNN
ncbi:MAG: hypothetical protein IJL45_02555 [Prevotella sp.]|nr:hypothetical protein [Prevotella sp.]